MFTKNETAATVNVVMPVTFVYPWFRPECKE